METAGGQEKERLRRLYENGGESAVQERRNEVERQRDRVREKLRETTNKYLTALAAVQELREFIDELDADEEYDTSDPIGNFRGFVAPLPTVWGSPMLRELKMRDAEGISDHVRDAIEAIELDNDDDQGGCSPGFWRLEEKREEGSEENNLMDVTAITDEESVVFRVCQKQPADQVHEEAEAKREQHCAEVEDLHQQVEELEHELRRHEDFLSKVFRGEIEKEGLPDIFEGRPTLRGHAAEIVKKYRSNPGSLPDGRNAMGRFRENWVPDSLDEERNVKTESSSKVSQIQRAIREAGISDKYSGGDPESFCDLVERLLEQHDKAEP